MQTIAVDAMGGDYAPEAVLEGVAQAHEGDCLFDKFLLVGDVSRLDGWLKERGLAGDERIEIVHAPEVVGMDESPTRALRTKKKSSVAIATDLVKDGKAAAVVSAGNTGVMVGNSLLKLRALPSIERPGIATVFPTPEGPFVLIDAGAHVDAKPAHLVHFATMGDVYARRILGVEQPRIGLLSVGTEAEKGNEVTKETHRRLSSMSALDFIGNVEGSGLFERVADVVVCDGFVGNIALKSCESIAEAFSSILRGNLKKNFLRKVGAFLAKQAFVELRELGDREEYGGAPLLGVNGICIIAHGASSPRAIENAIRVAGSFVACDVNKCIETRVSEVAAAPGAPNSDTCGE